MTKIRHDFDDLDKPDFRWLPSHESHPQFPKKERVLSLLFALVIGHLSLVIFFTGCAQPDHLNSQHSTFNTPFRPRTDWWKELYLGECWRDSSK